MKRSALELLCLIAMLSSGSMAIAQSVCLPAPRLLTVFPMGGQAGSESIVSIEGETIEGASELVFSHSGITAESLPAENTITGSSQFRVAIAEDCPAGVYEARVMTRLGLSSPRIFSVSKYKEITQKDASTTLDKAQPIELDSICNAVMPVRAVNHYSFQGTEGQRVLVDCAARGIDSELNPVVILADAEGNDLRVQRRGGVIDFQLPATGGYSIKVHDLTFNGGSKYFYRLALRALADDDRIVRMPTTQRVTAHSWPPHGVSAESPTHEIEPNNLANQSQQLQLPCDVQGSFYPAADVDRFQFQAKKGEEWWIEVGSERLGHSTDPTVVVQRVSKTDSGEHLEDVVELNDIASPVKVSSYGYSYDGPPYNAGSSDVMGKLEIKEDGLYRLQITDLLGSTRDDPNAAYRLIIRKATPDFAIVMWPLHMQLRNGDRNALSKPIALRGGKTQAYEVVAIRRDGFEGPIDLKLENLPDGVTATGLRIPKGKSLGTMLVTAADGAPRGYSIAKLTGHAMVGDQPIVRPGRMASMAFPIRNARNLVTSPRLVADIPVSVGGHEVCPMTISAKTQQVFEVVEGSKLKIPLLHMKRGEFSGANLNARTFGDGFTMHPKFDIPIGEDSSEVELDLAKLKTRPGDYTIAFYGGAVAKFAHYPDAVQTATSNQEKFVKQVSEANAEIKQLTAQLSTASVDEKASTEKRLADAKAAKNAADTRLAAAKKQLAAVKKLAAKKDIAEIFVSQPIKIRVKAAEQK